MNKKIVKAMVLIAIGIVLLIGIIFFKSNNSSEKDSSSSTNILNNAKTKQNKLSGEDFWNKFEKEYKKSEQLSSEWTLIENELKSFIFGNGEYLDQEEIMKKLPTLEIKYKEFDGNRNGQYLYKENKLLFSKDLKYRSEADKKNTIFHETLHFLFQEAFLDSKFNMSGDGVMLDEGLVSLLTLEYDCYGADYPDQYQVALTYTRIICEIIGADRFIQIAGNHDLNELIDEIAKLCSKNDAKELIKNIDKASERRNYSDRTEYDEKAWEIIQKMYKTKNGVSIDDSGDILMQLYFNITNNSSKDFNPKIYKAEDVTLFSIFQTNKRYFTNNSKNSITDRNKYNGNSTIEISLDENNRVIN